MTANIPYPDMTALPPELARAVSRLVRLLNELRRSRPDLDRVALSAETELDRDAALFVTRHVERLGIGFDVMLSPWDGRSFLADGTSPGQLQDQPTQAAPPELSARVQALRDTLKIRR